MMNLSQARKFRADYAAAVKLLNRKSAHELRAIENTALSNAGRLRLAGKMSKGELVTSILELNDMGIDRVNEATHVVAHEAVYWPGCPHCAAELETAPHAQEITR